MVNPVVRITNLETEKIDHKLWMVTSPLTFGTPYGLVTVPKNFITDGASCPTILYSLCTPMSGAHAEAAVLHDYLYSKDSNETFLVSREHADDYFLAAMLDNRTSKARAYAIYYGVRAGGSGSYKACYSIDKIKE